MTIMLPLVDNVSRRHGLRCSMLILSLLCMTACTHVSRSTGALPVAEALVEAFNEHDPEKMGRLVADDFELYYVDDKGEAALALTGRGQLVEEMAGYFAGNPSVQSTISDAIDGRAFVSFREQIVGGQSSISVYEIRDGLIQRAWYFPAE